MGLVPINILTQRASGYGIHTLKRDDTADSPSKISWIPMSGLAGI